MKFGYFFAIVRGHLPTDPKPPIPPSCNALCDGGSVHPVETFSSSFTGATPDVQRRSFARE